MGRRPREPTNERENKRNEESNRKHEENKLVYSFAFFAAVSVVTYENQLSGYVSMVHLVDSIRSKEANE